jgi:hypothetical protein
MLQNARTQARIPEFVPIVREIQPRARSRRPVIGVRIAAIARQPDRDHGETYDERDAGADGNNVLEGAGAVLERARVVLH